jgi:hypothetical protein
MTGTPRRSRRLFDFRLREIAQVVPWDTEGKKTLSWFGLTDGWFWINVGHDQLFRTREAWNGSDYVDYQVVRLWEDVLDILPTVLDPVPADIGSRLEPQHDWLGWYRRVHDRLAAAGISDAEAEQIERGTRWSTERRLDTGYLTAGPNIFFWRTEDTIHVAWDNRDGFAVGEPLWSSSHGHISMALADFNDEVKDFNDRLMSAMADRVDGVRREWPHPDVVIDAEQLDREQKERSTWLHKAVERADRHSAEDWDGVREEMRRLDRMLGAAP